MHQNLEGFVAQLLVNGPKDHYPVRSQMGIIGLLSNPSDQFQTQSSAELLLRGLMGKRTSV